MPVADEKPELDIAEVLSSGPDVHARDLLAFAVQSEGHGVQFEICTVDARGKLDGTLFEGKLSSTEYLVKFLRRLADKIEHG